MDYREVSGITNPWGYTTEASTINKLTYNIISISSTQEYNTTIHVIVTMTTAHMEQSNFRTPETTINPESN